MKSKKSHHTRKLKKVAYRFIRPSSPAGERLYPLLRELVDLHHEDLRDARIALAFQLSWKPDVDGRVILGQCKKLTDLERELFDGEAYDFVIILRQEFWLDEQVSDFQRRALLDHELMHAALKFDDRGEPVVDERGRVVYRTRKHDLEEFAEIADRYGCWKKDIEAFARALDRARYERRDRWISYTRLRDELAAAGLSIPLDVVATWSDDERREASTWAVLRLEYPLVLDVMPAHVAAVSPLVSKDASSESH